MDPRRPACAGQVGVRMLVWTRASRFTGWVVAQEAEHCSDTAPAKRPTRVAEVPEPAGRPGTKTLTSRDLVKPMKALDCAWPPEPRSTDATVRSRNTPSRT